MRPSRRGIALGMLGAAATLLLLLAACEPTQQAQSQATRGPTQSQYTTSTIDSTGKPNQALHLTDPDVPAHMVGVSVLGKDDKLTAWEPVESLKRAGPKDRVFTVEARADGTTVIRFGDGKHGAVPPAGGRNIRVRYIGGAGAQGQTVLQHIGSRALTAELAGPSTETIDAPAAQALRKHARARTYQVTTGKDHADGSATVTTYDVSGRDLDQALREIQRQSKQAGKIVSVEVTREEPDEDDVP